MLQLLFVVPLQFTKKAMTSVAVMLWCALVLCVSYTRLTAQPITDQCSSDDNDDTDRQLQRMEQMMSALHVISERQQSLMEQMYCLMLEERRKGLNSPGSYR